MNAVIWVILPALMLGSSVDIALGQAAQVSIVGVPVVTVCEALHDMRRYNGKSIVVVGRFGSTDEGSWLSEDCERKIITDGYTWDNAISTTYASSNVEPPTDLPNGFKWNKELLTKKLKDVQKTTKLQVVKQYHYSDKWVAIFGRFETRLPLQVAVGGSGMLMGYGFGHLNTAPAQLISGHAGFHELKAK